jgi:phosphoribosylanthranilate isomerase
MWIKICGITSIEDAEMVVAAGADAIGFVFAESPRRISAQTARDIIQRLAPSVEKIGVFVDATGSEMAETMEVAGLSGVQLHGSADGLKNFRGGVGEEHESIRVLQVVRYDGDSDRFALELRKLHEHQFLGDQSNAVLVDTCVAGKQGGTGVAFDWQAARDSFRREAPHLRLIAAGGLHPENVRNAIHTLRPWGVDVSSGVESAPGRKDPNRVAAFVRAAREADAELG